MILLESFIEIDLTENIVYSCKRFSALTEIYLYFYEICNKINRLI